jgi:hypothetical protein
MPLNAYTLSCFDIDFYLLLGIEKPSVATKLNLTLSADHRVFDGKVGGMCNYKFIILQSPKWHGILHQAT